MHTDERVREAGYLLFYFFFGFDWNGGDEGRGGGMNEVSTHMLLTTATLSHKYIYFIKQREEMLLLNAHLLSAILSTRPAPESRYIPKTTKLFPPAFDPVPQAPSIGILL